MSKSNPRLTNLIDELEAVARETDADIWIDVADRLAMPRRTHAEVNLGRIERYADGERTVVVPGKVLGSGALRKNVRVAAVDFSRAAERKIDAADGTAVRLEAEIEENPGGNDLQVIG